MPRTPSLFYLRPCTSFDLVASIGSSLCETDRSWTDETRNKRRCWRHQAWWPKPIENISEVFRQARLTSHQGMKWWIKPLVALVHILYAEWDSKYCYLGEQEPDDNFIVIYKKYKTERYTPARRSAAGVKKYSDSDLRPHATHSQHSPAEFGQNEKKVPRSNASQQVSFKKLSHRVPSLTDRGTSLWQKYNGRAKFWMAALQSQSPCRRWTTKLSFLVRKQ